MTEQPPRPDYRQIADFADAWRRALLPPAIPSPPQPPQIPEPIETWAVDWASDALLRAAAFETGAIEDLYRATAGATRNIAEQVDGWERELEDSGEDATESFEDQLAGYEWARTLATGADQPPLGPVVLRDMHAMVTRRQLNVDTNNGLRPLEHGEYKRTTNYVIDRFGREQAYCPSELVSAEVTYAFDLYRELRDAGADPVVLSAFLHWAIAHIHPFPDGNGRTARAIASVPLLSDDGVPLLVFSDRKQVYLQSLEAADYEAVGEAIAYARQRVADTIAWRDDLARSREMNSTGELNTSIMAILAAQTEPAEDTTVLYERIITAIEAAITAKLAPLRESGFKVATTGRADDYRVLEASLQEPIAVSTPIQVNVSNLPYHAGGGYSVVTHVAGMGGPGITLRTHDVSPAISSEAVIRIEVLADTVARQTMGDINATVAAVARARGTLPGDALPVPPTA